jgi:membrane fusion protein (multidrug efflux system)
MRPTLLVLSLLLVSLSACDEEPPHHESIRHLPAAHPERRSVDLSRNYVCQLRAIQHIELRALERGYLERIHVDEGQLVHEGELMFQVMPRVYQAERDRAEAELDYAEIEYANTKTLAEGNVVSESELALAGARRAKAQAELALADVHRSLTEIHAPFSGIMGRFHVRLGSLLDEGELLTTLSDNSTIWAYFNVSEAEYLDFLTQPEGPVNQEAELVLANGVRFAERGRIETIEADFHSETGNIAFRAAFPNPDRVLRHGQTGKVVLTTRIENALLIAQKATFDVLDRKHVWVVDEEGLVHSRRIEVSEEIPHYYVVESGLDESAVVLLEGLRRVHEGSEVEPEILDADAVARSLELHAE